MAIDKLEPASPARTDVQSCLQSHQSRVTLLRDAILAAGGTPVDSSGPWGVFAKVVEGGASVLGDKAAIAALEEGEDHGVKDYRSDMAQFDATTQSLILSKLQPEQLQTHSKMSALKKRLSA